MGEEATTSTTLPAPSNATTAERHGLDTAGIPGDLSVPKTRMSNNMHGDAHEPDAEPLTVEVDLPLPSSDADHDGSHARSDTGVESLTRNGEDVEDSSLNEDSALHERIMRRRLLDIESSFIPEQPQVAMEGHTTNTRAGIDDTYLFGGSPGGGRGPEHEDSVDQSENLGDMSMATPPEAYKTPGPVRQAAGEVEGETSMLGTETPSPSAAAARRTHARVLSMEKPEPEEPALQSQPAHTNQQLAPEYPLQAALNGTVIEQQDEADVPLVQLPDELLLSPKSEASSAPTLRGSPRTRATHSRQHSQFSTLSALSHHTDTSAEGAMSDARSDGEGVRNTCPMQPGSRVVSNSMSLSRLPSASSIISSVTDATDSKSERNRLSSRSTNLETLHERGEPATPRPKSVWAALSSTNPTDTLITQHVRNIHVPETVAREFARTHAVPRTSSPEKRSGTLSFSQAGGKNTLTLKEQNSKIDKLSKENFDLKLKIHFLDQALQNRSDEGVKDMIDKNVQLQTDLANEKKETQNLRRKLRELERKLKGYEDAQGANQKRDVVESDEDGSATSRYGELEDEITYLRQCLQHSETQVERFRGETMSRELERRKLADHIKSLSDNQSRRTAQEEPLTGVEEAMEMWKDLLEAETARREQADEDAQRARDEAKAAKQQVTQLQSQMTSSARPTSSGNNTTTNHIRNTFHINKRQMYSYNGLQPGEGSGDGASTPGLSNDHDQMGNGGAVRGGTAGEAASISTTSTLVEQLRHENAELRRDLGAQTSMLTSRNRERERLQQEIEDLKLHARRAGVGGLGSIAGDSIFERSVSRAGANQAHGRSTSRMSGGTSVVRAAEEDVVPLAQLEKEREGWELQLNSLKDQVSSAKMLSQDLERECNSALDELERSEKEIGALQEERTALVEDLQALQAERDEALLALEEKEDELRVLREEAEGLIAELEDKGEAGEVETDRIMADLDARNEDFSALQGEMRSVSEKLVVLEDDMAGKRRRIGVLEGEARDYEREIEELDTRVRDLSGKNERLEVQLESTQGEISFLREEQEGDKIKIGELEASLASAQQAYQEERERVEEERRQREVLESEEKGEVQKMMDEINAQLSKARDEVRKLRKSLSSKEVEASTWKERLDTLEGGLRTALGDINGTRSTFLMNIQELQTSLDNTTSELDATRAELAEKKAEMHQHNSLLESTSLESRRLADLLDKERTSHRQARAQVDHVTRQHQMSSRSLQAHEVKTAELETQRSADRRKIGQLEDRFREQLLERNNLLLTLWRRLSALCGNDWSQRYTLVDGHMPSVAVIERNLPGFAKLVVSAVKELETAVSGFRTRVKAIEKELWTDFQTLEHSLDQRFKRLEVLEGNVAEHGFEARGPTPPDRKSSIRSVFGRTDDLARLSHENKMLKAELQILRSGSGAGGRPMSVAESMRSGDSQPLTRSISTSAGYRDFGGEQQHNSYGTAELAAAAESPVAASPTISRTNSAKRNTSTSRSVRGMIATGKEAERGGSGVNAPLQPSEARWIHRLKELERRLKAEREARLLDRSGARKRLQQGQRENEELRGQVERERLARESRAE